MLGSLSDARCSELARESLRWTGRVLNEQTRGHLATLPLTATVPGALLAHGSPENVSEYVTTTARADDLLDGLPDLGLLLLGHTHEPWAYARGAGTSLRGGGGTVALRPGESHLLNPGSVGQSRDQVARARFLTLDLDERLAHFRCVRYDVKGCRAALRRAGLPSRSHHIRPPWFARVRRRLARLVT